MMMKWGGRKAGSSSPSVSSHHHASPFSWFSKFKHMRINSSSEPTTTHHANTKKQNNTSDAITIASSTVADDASSSLFGEEFHYEDNVIDSSSSFPAAARRNSSARKHTTREGALINNNKNKLKEKKESGIIPKEERKFVDDRKVQMEMQEYTRDDKEYENLRRRFERKAQKVLQEQLFNLEKERGTGRESRKLVQEIKDVEMQLDSPRTICTPRIHYSLPSSSDSKSSNSVRSKKNNNILEKKLMLNPTEELNLNLNLKVKTKKKKQQTVVDGSSSREIIHQRRKSKHSPRIRIHSPRMSSPKIDQVCRIKAIEDMKKARLKMKKEREEIIVQEALLTKGSEDRFAVIKCSLDPRKDFRDSMIEMIIEKQIRNPEEMEELLACYLTLNADEYHDLIIQVFRQVWFQMSYGA